MCEMALAGAPRKLICVVLGASSDPGSGVTCTPVPGNRSERLVWLGTHWRPDLLANAEFSSTIRCPASVRVAAVPSASASPSSISPLRKSTLAATRLEDG